eukprot:2184676-Alexandrium_andersonii.AAC.1
MCIRDRRRDRAERLRRRRPRGQVRQLLPPRLLAQAARSRGRGRPDHPVSYTHLTLPTLCSV